MIDLHTGDCLDVLRTLDAGCADVLITDPPAGIAFMGAEWDSNKGGRDLWIAWLAERLAEACRILPAGACGLVWALPRTSHWTALACEYAGFQIVDRVSHIFGSGFPKHKHALKPAVEDWWLVQKPGAARRLNVDACRVEVMPMKGDGWRPNCYGKQYDYAPGTHLYGEMIGQRPGNQHPAGRWPAHLVLSHSPTCNGVCAPDCPIRVVGEQSGERKSAYPGNDSAASAYHGAEVKPGIFGGNRAGRSFSDTGTAARFFPNLPADDAPPFIYAPKASRRERNAGCEGLEEKNIHRYNNGDGFSGRTNTDGEWKNTDAPRIPTRNHHPTVKSQALMRWLVRLITPDGGTVLDPFMGSGSTGVAAIAEGRGFIGIEQSPEYQAIADARIAHALSEARQEVLL